VRLASSQSSFGLSWPSPHEEPPVVSLEPDDEDPPSDVAVVASVVVVVVASVVPPDVELVEVPASVSLPLVEPSMSPDEESEVSLPKLLESAPKLEPESDVASLESAEEETDPLGPLDVVPVIPVVVPSVVDEVESALPVWDDELPDTANSLPPPQPKPTPSVNTNDHRFDTQPPQPARTTKCAGSLLDRDSPPRPPPEIPT